MAVKSQGQGIVQAAGWCKPATAWKREMWKRPRGEALIEGVSIVK